MSNNEFNPDWAHKEPHLTISNLIESHAKTKKQIRKAIYDIKNLAEMENEDPRKKGLLDAITVLKECGFGD